MATERADRDPMIGQLFAGRFQVERRVGAGGMGNIYRAMQVDMKRPVALKVLHADLGDDPEVLGRFDREMRATTRIEHPNSIRVYEHGRTPQGQLYLAMELLEGRQLSDVISEEAPFAPDRVAHVGMQIAQALAAAHEEKIVHRDLKPENIMLLDRYGQKDFVKVLDFGLSRFSEDDFEDENGVGLTQAGVRVGTPGYMAPEYVSHFAFDARSDLYALGVILFEMITGVMPFTGRPYEILEKVIHEDPPPPSSIEAACPKWLDEIVLRLMAKNPDDRPQKAMEAAFTLERGRARLISEPPTEQDLAALRKALADEPTQEAPPAPLAPVHVSAPVATSSLLGKARTGRGAQPRNSTPPSRVPTDPQPPSRVPTLPEGRPARRSSTQAGTTVALAGCAGVGLLIGAGFLVVVVASVLVMWM